MQSHWESPLYAQWRDRRWPFVSDCAKNGDEQHKTVSDWMVSLPRHIGKRSRTWRQCGTPQDAPALGPWCGLDAGILSAKRENFCVLHWLTSSSP